MGKKEHYGRELWDRMRSFVASEEDPLYSCGEWTIQKLFFLCQYLATTTRAMVGNPNFESVNYVDLFASCGVCAVTGKDGRKRNYPGSALLAAGCQKAFNNIYLVERDAVLLGALKSRIAKLNTKSIVHDRCGDANVVVDELVKILPPRSLTVAFIDPYSLDIHFESIRKLAQARQLDLLILFSDAMDVVRNVEEYYYPRISPNLDLFLGAQSNWRQKWDQLTDRSGAKCRDFFGDVYLSQLALLGYKFTARKTIRGESGPLYSLVYACKRDLGLKFWNIAASEDLEGTKTLWS